MPMKQRVVNIFLKFYCGSLLPVLLTLLPVLIPFRGVSQVLPRVEHLINRANELRNSNPDQAMQLATMAMDEARL
jgi:hypothetical protein